MSEEQKYSIMDTEGLLNPFIKVNIVMEKVFSKTKNHELSIQEIWDQINKLKEVAGINKTRDGIYLSTDSIDQIRPDEVDKNQNVSKLSQRDNTKEVSFEHDSTLLSNKNQEEKLDKLLDVINDQNKRIEKLESRLSYIANRAEDKFENYEQEIHTLTKVRLDDLENTCKNLELAISKNLEDQKEKDYHMTKEYRGKIEEVEVSIRKFKRSLSMGFGPNPEEQKEAEGGKSSTLLQTAKKDQESLVRQLSDTKQGIPEISKEILNTGPEEGVPAHSQANQYSAGFSMIWDEIDKLRAKFSDFVH